MEKEQFLKGVKNQGLCDAYAVKFKNTYTKYKEREEKSRQDFIYEHGISEDEFLARYGEEWEARWFYIGEDIVEFYNEMGWDFNKLSASKKLLYSGEYETSYKNYVIQDIWDHLLREQECEYVCWGVFNFINILQETEEQKKLKSELQKLMNELYQYTVDETEMNEGALSKYIKENRGIECTFGHIEIDIKNNRLGQGGNGVVFSGLLGKSEVAVKFLVNYTRKKLDRFKAEYINVNMVREKMCNAVNYLHYETLKVGSAEVPFIVMKKYNTSLKKQRDDMGHDVTWEDLLKLFENLCKAIKSLEQNSIIHRDLKPENILVDENGNYIITDFGIAHFESERYPIKGLTKKNDRMANWEFSAPEQVSGGKITSATDIYALGQILYWFCFGEINRGTGGKHLQEIFDEEKVAVLDKIIYKSISNQAENRYQSIQEIEEEFNCVQKKNVDVYVDMHLFSRAIRSIFPEAYRNPFFSSGSIVIKEEAFERMKNDPEYENYVLNRVRSAYSVQGLPVGSNNVSFDVIGASPEECYGYAGPVGKSGSETANDGESWWEKRHERMEELMKEQEKEAVKRAQVRRKAVQNEYLNSQLAAAAYEKSSIILPDNPVIL